LRFLLQTCGHIASYNRPNKAFCFIEFSDPDSVLRALTTLNELELPGLPHGEGHPSKKLKVKADAKTGKFLEEWKSKRDSTNDAALDDQAKARIEQVVGNIRDPNYRLPGDSAESKASYETPAHLKDLTEEELPEEVRGSVLGEIAQFRVSASAREEDKRRKEAEMQRIRQAERMRARPPAQAPLGPASSNMPGPSRQMGMGDGPQSYRDPVTFVPTNQMNGVKLDDMNPEERDELEEKMRQEKLAETRRMDAQLVSVARDKLRIGSALTMCSLISGGEQVQYEREIKAGAMGKGAGPGAGR
jgi:RNA-binding protein 25